MLDPKQTPVVVGQDTNRIYRMESAYIKVVGATSCGTNELYIYEGIRYKIYI